MKTILKIENLYKSFADSLVLQDISFEVSKGEVLCLIGPSGSGKTTLVRCINFLETPDSGNIYLEDKLLGYDQKNGKLIKQNEYKISKDRSEKIPSVIITSWNNAIIEPMLNCHSNLTQI